MALGHSRESSGTLINPPSRDELDLEPGSKQVRGELAKESSAVLHDGRGGARGVPVLILSPNRLGIAAFLSGAGESTQKSVWKQVAWQEGGGVGEDIAWEGIIESTLGESSLHP